MEAPKGKKFYGAVTVSERGQIVIPVEARQDFNIKPGEKMLVLGDLEQGLAIVPYNFMQNLMQGTVEFFKEVENEVKGQTKDENSDHKGDQEGE